MKNKARVIAEKAFDVSFSTDDFGNEMRNLTNSASLCKDDEILHSFVIADNEEERISVTLVAEHNQESRGVKLKISRQTAEQIIDALQQVLATPFEQVQKDLEKKLVFGIKHGE